MSRARVHHLVMGTAHNRLDRNAANSAVPHKRRDTQVCISCYQGTATITLERAATTLVFKHVPALVRETYGEEYVGEDVTRMLLVHAEEAIKAGVEVDVWYYRAA